VKQIIVRKQSTDGTLGAEPHILSATWRQLDLLHVDAVVCCQ